MEEQERERRRLVVEKFQKAPFEEIAAHCGARVRTDLVEESYYLNLAPNGEEVHDRPCKNSQYGPKGWLKDTLVQRLQAPGISDQQGLCLAALEETKEGWAFITVTTLNRQFSPASLVSHVRTSLQPSISLLPFTAVYFSPEVTAAPVLAANTQAMMVHWLNNCMSPRGLHR